MDGFDLIPSAFSISEAARQVIEEELAKMAAFSPGDWVAAMVWMADESDGDNAGPGLGFYERGTVGAPPIVTIAGLDVMFALSNLSKCLSGKILNRMNHL
jgi:hypothetical protein